MLIRWPRRLGALGTTLLLAACGGYSVAASAQSVNIDPLAVSPCQSVSTEFGQRYPDAPVQLVGAFQSTIDTVVSWQENRHGPNGPQPTSRWRKLGKPTDVVYVCYLDGEFSGFPTDPAGATPPPPYDRMVVLVDALGAARIDAVGHRNTLSIVRPTRP
jgi:hypothetical protein